MKWYYPLKLMNWKREECRSFSKTDRSMQQTTIFTVGKILPHPQIPIDFCHVV